MTDGEGRGPIARSAAQAPGAAGDPTPVAASRPRGHRRRPPAVTVVAVSYLVMSGLWAAMAIQAQLAAQVLLPPGGGLLDTEAVRSDFTLIGGIVVIRQVSVGLTALVAGIALLRMHPRGWLLGMIAAVAVLAVQLVSWSTATPNYLLMALAVGIVLLMNQTEVRDAFAQDATRGAT